MKIAVIGYGSVGKKFAELFCSVGYEVIVGLRSVPVNPIPYPHASFKEAAKAADMIALAIPFSACADVLPGIAEDSKGKVVIDSTNPLNPDWSPKLLGQEDSAGEEVSRLLPGAQVVKAFNTIFADVMDKPVRDGQQITAFIAGDDDSAKHIVANLAAKIGYAPVDTGPLYTARYLESMAHLNIQIAVGQEGGTDAAFIYSQG
ncbi:MAG: NADPH-dependent F420 reductase [Cyanobacteria bacterium P01_A01_bin.116]